MKIATWNLGYMSPGAHKGKIKEAYDYFFNEIQADFHLFQEGSIDDLGAYAKKVEFEKISYFNQKAITGVYSQRKKIKKIETEQSLPGSFCAVDAGDICLTSLYAIVDHLDRKNDRIIYYAGNLHKIFSDMGHILWNYHKKFKWHLVGGDFNTDPSYHGNTKDTKADLLLLERRITESFALKNCNHEAKIKKPTYRSSRGSEYQLDYIYLSQGKSMKSLSIVKNEQTQMLSDHLPLVIEL